MSSEGAPLEVLVVDDVPEIVHVVAQLVARVRACSVRVTTSSDASEALALARERPFHLVITDYRMPRVDGISILKAARERNPNGHRVLMTGYNEIPEGVESLRAAAPDAYLYKPLPMKELAELLRDFLPGAPPRIEAYQRKARAMEDEADPAARARA